MPNGLPRAFLTLPAEGDLTFAGVVRKFRLFLVRRLLVAASQGQGARTAAFARFADMLTSALRQDPERTLAIFASPDVATALLTFDLDDAHRDQRLLDAVSGVLAGLASAVKGVPRLLSDSVLFEAPVARLIDTEQRWALALEPPARALLGGPAGVEVELPSGSHAGVDDLILGTTPGVRALTPFHRLSAAAPDLVLSELDTNPFAMHEEHPEKAGNRLSLGGRSLDEWKGAFADALELIRIALPTWFAELGSTLRRILPVGYEPERHLSASYREAPGVAYLTLHPDPVTLAEAIIHETQHGKLNVLSWLDPVLKNGYSTWTPSPVRPDLRPLMGVLLAVHAFVPVAALHEGLVRVGHPLAASTRFVERRSQVLRGNAEGLAVLGGSSDPTPTGRRLLDELGALHAALLDRAGGLGTIGARAGAAETGAGAVGARATGHLENLG